MLRIPKSEMFPIADSPGHLVAESVREGVIRKAKGPRDGVELKTGGDRYESWKENHS